VTLTVEGEDAEETLKRLIEVFWKCNLENKEVESRNGTRDPSEVGARHEGIVKSVAPIFLTSEGEEVPDFPISTGEVESVIARYRQAPLI